MDKEAFKIYVDQLRDGHIETIHEILSPDFMEVKEEDLLFQDEINVDGEAYLAEDEVVLHLEIFTKATIPCSICNERVKIDVSIPDFYHAEPLQNIKTGIFNYKEILRESILLETPSFAECHDGKCPKRNEFKKYLKESGREDGKSDEEGYQPFADLKLQ
jgi:uncharacterized metal-binding protein YceD (DUF177 family)